jgi:hypothetical protein
MFSGPDRGRVGSRNLLRERTLWIFAATIVRILVI